MRKGNRKLVQNSYGLGSLKKKKNKILWLTVEEVTSNTATAANPVIDTKVCCIFSCSSVRCSHLVHRTVRRREV